MPQRGLTIDPSRPLAPQIVGVSVRMPYGWLQTFNKLAEERNMPTVALMRCILREFAENNEIELVPPYHR